MRTGKAQPACGGVLSAEGAIDEYGAALDRNNGISGDIVIVDNGTAIIKNRFAQNAAGFPQALILQRDPLRFDDVLDRDHSGNAIIEIRIIGGDDFAGDPLQSLFPVIWYSHALVSLSSPDVLIRRLIRSIKSCHSWSVASASLAVRNAARTISRSMM